jgi:hypothetical protein
MQSGKPLEDEAIYNHGEWLNTFLDTFECLFKWEKTNLGQTVFSNCFSTLAKKLKRHSKKMKKYDSPEKRGTS